MDPGAASRALQADPQGNGVTGFVAATGKSYLCEDTQTDPLYLPGAPGARSSLTVPLILHDEILGTFNVESPKPGAFNENDLQFLELFSREVAVAINTFELLAVEKMTTASASTDRILREVASPVDEILNDAACILERYIGHEPIVSERLQRILKHTRNIKQLIQKVGETFAPLPSHAPLMPRQQRPLLRGKRILVVDADESVRIAAHELLGRYGCEVETAHNARRGVRHGPQLPLRRGDCRHPPARHDRLRLLLSDQADSRAPAGDLDDRFRLRPGPLDREGPPARLEIGALQTVPAGAAAHRSREGRLVAGRRAPERELAPLTMHTAGLGRLLFSARRRLGVFRDVRNLKQRVRQSSPLRIVVGAGGLFDPGWIPTDVDVLDILDEAHWRRLFRENSIDAILAEHVWEHLTAEQGLLAARNCYRFPAPRRLPQRSPCRTDFIPIRNTSKGCVRAATGPVRTTTSCSTTTSRFAGSSNRPAFRSSYSSISTQPGNFTRRLGSGTGQNRPLETVRRAQRGRATGLHVGHLDAASRRASEQPDPAVSHQDAAPRRQAESCHYIRDSTPWHTQHSVVVPVES